METNKNSTQTTKIRKTHVNGFFIYRFPGNETEPSNAHAPGSQSGRSDGEFAPAPGKQLNEFLIRQILPDELKNCFFLSQLRGIRK